MKIKTITCHDVYNVGASLQAFALVTYLRQLGHDAEIVDYKPFYLSNHYKLLGVGNPKYDRPVLREIYNILKFPGRLRARLSRRKKEYDDFTNDYLPLTTKRYTSNEELKNDPPEADLFFAGSDQIWNTLFQNGKDPAFYLDFVPEGVRRASYAASFATDDIMEEWKPKVKQWLSNMDDISVRESSGLLILDNLGIKNAVQVLDPVFLLKGTDWEKLEKDLSLCEPYLLLYDFEQNPQIAECARTLAKKNGWKVYSVLHNPCCDRCFDQEGPLAFLYLIHHARFVLSNSFHATAFSLIFQKEFITFDRGEKINTRMRDLLSSVGVENRYGIDTKWNEPVEPIDYERTAERLETAIVESKRFIDSVIQSVKQ